MILSLYKNHSIMFLYKLNIMKILYKLLKLIVPIERNNLMKKTINGKLYNTETARLVGTWEIRGKEDDPRNIKERLYQKKTGEYFLYGEGGAKSRYRRSSGDNCWTYGYQIIPLTYESAERWAKEHLDSEESEAIFGNMFKDETKRIICVSVTVATHEKLKRIAVEKSTSVGNVIESLLEEQMQLETERGVLKNE